MQLWHVADVTLKALPVLILIPWVAIVLRSKAMSVALLRSVIQLALQRINARWNLILWNSVQKQLTHLIQAAMLFAAPLTFQYHRSQQHSKQQQFLLPQPLLHQLLQRMKNLLKLEMTQIQVVNSPMHLMLKLPLQATGLPGSGLL